MPPKNPSGSARRIDPYKLAMEIALAAEQGKKLDWNAAATELGSASANALKMAWSNQKKKYNKEQDPLAPKSSDKVQKTQTKKAPGSKKIKAQAEDGDGEESEEIVKKKKKTGGKKGKKVEVVKEQEDTGDNDEPNEADATRIPFKNESDTSIEFEELK